MKNRHLINIAWRRLREYLRLNYKGIQTYRLGDMKYCLQKYFELNGGKLKNKKSSIVLLEIYNDPLSVIFKGHKIIIPKRKKIKKQSYEMYLKSGKWRKFRRMIIWKRGCRCELCLTPTIKLDIHHKTYARLFNELESDVLCICRQCHENIHGKKIA